MTRTHARDTSGRLPVLKLRWWHKLARYVLVKVLG